MIECHKGAIAELGLAARYGGKSPVTGRGGAEGGIDQGDSDPGVTRPSGDGFRAFVIGADELDVRESGRRRRGKTGGQRHLGEQESDIGDETRHGL